MKGVRFLDSPVVHAYRPGKFAKTSCGLWVAWLYLAPDVVEVNDEVDCMTCLVRLAREPGLSSLTNPCAEIDLPASGDVGPFPPRGDPGEPEPLPPFPNSGHR